MWFDEHVARYEGVQGGDPVVAGTRTPVSTIVVFYYQVYGRDIAAVHAALPHLTRLQVEAALAYYDAHRCEIDAEIEENERLLREFELARR